MKIFIVIAFLLLGLVFWVLSGGSDLDPLSRSVTEGTVPADAAQSGEAAEPPPEVASEAAPDVPVPPEPAAPASVASSAPLPPEPVAEAAPPAPAEPPTAMPEAPAALPEQQAAAPQAAPAPDLAAAPQPVLPAEPLRPAEALAAIAPDLAAPSAPPTRRTSLETASSAGTQAGPEARIEAAWRRVVADRVNLREGPGTDFPSLGLLDEGDRTEVLDEDGGWLRVRTASGSEGWVSARFVAEAEG